VVCTGMEDVKCEESAVRHKGIDGMGEAVDTHRKDLAGRNSDFQWACMHWAGGGIERVVALCEVTVEEYDPFVIVVGGDILRVHLEDGARDIELPVDFHLSLQDLEGRRNRVLT
jgi:hypothetical protein